MGEGKPADARSDIYSFGCVLYAAELERELAGVTATGSRGKRMLAAAAAILGLSAAAYFYFHRAPRFTNKDTIVLADFVAHS